MISFDPTYIDNDFVPNYDFLQLDLDLPVFDKSSMTPAHDNIPSAPYEEQFWYQAQSPDIPRNTGNGISISPSFALPPSPTFTIDTHGTGSTSPLLSQPTPSYPQGPYQPSQLWGSPLSQWSPPSSASTSTDQLLPFLPASNTSTSSPEGSFYLPSGGVMDTPSPPSSSSPASSFDSSFSNSFTSSLSPTADSEYIPSPLPASQPVRKANHDLSVSARRPTKTKPYTKPSKSKSPTKRIRGSQPSRNRVIDDPDLQRAIQDRLDAHSAASLPDFSCPVPDCKYETKKRRRMPDYKRHLETHLPEKLPCIGVLIEDADRYDVPDGAEMFCYEGKLRIGGCQMMFSRADSLKRHLDVSECIDYRSECRRV